MTKNTKYLLTLYNKNDKIIEEIEISHRNEREAEKESQYYIRSCKQEVFDWTLTEVN